ncbi:weak chloroplast movement under blue light protein (DUF827) [Wolffia australiana]
MMGVKTHQNAAENSKSEVGEIDTRAPFESVKAAVSLFGEAAFMADKPLARKSKPPVAESIVAKETQLQVAQKELSRLTEQLNNAEATRAEALAELEQAKAAVDDLTRELKLVNESKTSALKVTESARAQIKKLEEGHSGPDSKDGPDWALELDSSREQFSIIIAELDGVKQELSRTRRDLKASMDSKASASRREAESEKLTLSNRERVAQLLKETEVVKETLVQVKLALSQSQDEESTIQSNKELKRQAQMLAIEAAQKEAASLKADLDPDILKALEAKLAEVEEEVNAAEKELADVKRLDLETCACLAADLEAARNTLQQVAEEELSLKGSTELLRSELERIRKENAELIETETRIESLVDDLDRKLREAKAELRIADSRQLKAETARDELISARAQLVLEAEDAKREAEEMERKAAELREKVAATAATLDEAEKKLHAALREAEAAKAAEEIARNEMKQHTGRTSVAGRSSTSDSDDRITISGEEHRSLNQTVEDSETVMEMKVAAALAQVEAVRASEHEALRRLETVRLELKEVNSATEEALKKAEMAQAARRAVEAELKRWRQREQAAAMPTETTAQPLQLGTIIKGSSSSGHQLFG